MLQEGKQNGRFHRVHKGMSSHHWHLSNMYTAQWSHSKWEWGDREQKEHARSDVTNLGFESRFYTLMRRVLSRMNGPRQDGLNSVLDSTQSAKLLQQMLLMTPLWLNWLWPWFLNLTSHSIFGTAPLCLSSFFWLLKINGIYYGTGLTYVKKKKHCCN